MTRWQKWFGGRDETAEEVLQSLPKCSRSRDIQPEFTRVSTLFKQDDLNVLVLGHKKDLSVKRHLSNELDLWHMV
jgi:hypothetical protein